MESSVFNSVVKFSRRILLVSLTLLGTSFSALGQTQNPQPIQQPTPAIAPAAPSPISVSAPQTRTKADETFELNIVERRYSQENFEASTAIGTGGDSQKLNLQIGVALVSGKIDVLLRNVHGTVRFRGNLERLFQIIGDTQPPAPANSPASFTPPPPKQ